MAQKSEWVLIVGLCVTIVASTFSHIYSLSDSLLGTSLSDVALIAIPLALLTVAVYSLLKSMEAKKAEKALRESKAKYRVLTDSLPEVIFEMDLQGNLSWVNKRAFEEFGYGFSDFSPGRWNALDMLIAGDRNRAAENIAKIRDGEDVGLSEYTCIKHDGTTFPALFRTELIKDRNGNPAGFRGIILDITERKNQEIALANSEMMRRIITETAGDGIIMINSSGQCTFWNPAAEKIFGYTEDEMKGRDLHKMLAPEKYRDAYSKGFEEFRNTGKGDAIDRTVELEGRRKDGTQFPLEITLRAICQDDQWLAVGIIRDITQRKNVEKLMREEVDRTNRWFEELKEGAFVSTVEGILLNANASAAGLLGYSDVNDLIGEDAKDYYVDPKQREELIAEIKAHGFVRNRLINMKKKDGTAIRLATTVYLKSGKLFGRLLAEEELRMESLIPICSVMECRKIRDKSGRWHRFEDYFTENYEYRFSHSICPSCAQLLYPEKDTN